MAYKEIVTKAVIGKGKKMFTNHYSVEPDKKPSNVLGCWVINHKFEGTKENDKIRVKGSSDVNIWYSCEDNTKTEVVKQTINYDELLNVNRKASGDISSNEEVIVRSLKGPTCTKVEIIDGKIEYDVEKELGIEIVGDSKVKVQVGEEVDDWDIIEDENEESKAMDEIDNEVKENFINES